MTDSRTILNDPTFVPPAAPSSLTSGPTLELRQAMARFSGPPEHVGRRAAVVAVIDAIDTVALKAAAHRLTATHTQHAVDAASASRLAAESARYIATMAMAQTLGIAMNDHGEDAVSAVSVIAAVIGRGEDRQVESDQAVEWLAKLVKSPTNSPSDDVVSVLSVLYQNCDATTALIVETLEARAAGTPRRQAVLKTVRQATVDSAIARAGEIVTVDLEKDGLEFGAGPHQCPGRPPAEAIVAGVLSGLDESWPS